LNYQPVILIISGSPERPKENLRRRLDDPDGGLKVFPLGKSGRQIGLDIMPAGGKIRLPGRQDPDAMKRGEE
jgi:hypothetical protein